MAKVFFIPFGRRTTDSQRTQAEADILVGRDQERAYLTNLLNNCGNRAAVLVTGRRGAGKTTFVDHCISEYKKSVFKRFLRSRKGRPFWGLFLIVFFAVLLPLTTLIATDLLELLIPAVSSNPFLIVLILPAILLGAVPLLYAHGILKETLSGADVDRPTLHATAIAGILAITLHVIPFASAPAYSIAAIALAAAGLAAMDLVRRVGKLPDRLVNFLADSEHTNLKPYLFCAFLIGLFTLTKYASGIFFPINPSYHFYVLAITFSLYVIAIYIVIESIRSNLPKSYKHFGTYVFGSAMATVTSLLAGRAVLYIDEDVVNSPIISFLFFDYKVFTSLVMIAVGALLINACFERLDQANGEHVTEERSPRFYLLLIKAFFLITISYQILYPANPYVLFQNTRHAPLKIVADCATYPVSPATPHSYFDEQCAQLQTLANLEARDASQADLGEPPRIIAEPAFMISNVMFELESSAIGGYFSTETTPAEDESEEAVARADDPQESELAGQVFPTLFSAPLEEEFWYIAFLIVLLIIYTLEYEWIAKSSLWDRDARTIRPFKKNNNLKPAPPTEGGENNKEAERLDRVARFKSIHQNEEYQKDLRKRHRAYERASFVWHVCKAWMPSIVVKVNLGFDSLNHRGVTQAMLLGLRDAYRRKFLSWSSIYVLVGTFFGALILLFATQIVTNRAFSLPPSAHLENLAVPSQANECGLLEVWHAAEMKETKSPGNFNNSVPLRMCRIAPGFTSAMIPVFYYPLLEIPYGQDSVSEHLVFAMVDSNQSFPEFSPDLGLISPYSQTETITFRVYHLAVIAILFLLSSIVFRANPFLPYQSTYRRIEGALASLTSTRTTRKRSIIPFSGTVQSLLGQDVVSERNEAKSDPRSVELLFMSILEDIQNPGRMFPFAFGANDAIPTPEITFVFDELDKISGLVNAEDQTWQTADQAQQFLESDRQRTQALHALLSDMKRVISSAPARFVFVGNRLLHDEWIADNTRREALLTSIFDDEIYLKSLLLDHDYVNLSVAKPRWDDRVWEYLARIYRTGQSASKRSAEVRKSPFFSLPRTERTEPTFADDHIWAQSVRGGMRRTFDDDAQPPENLGTKNEGSIFPVVDWRSSDEGDFPHPVFLDAEHPNWQRHVVTQLVGFLSMRSVGNPKKLTQLFSSLIQPADTALWRNLYYETYLQTGIVPTASLSLERHNEQIHSEDIVLLDDKVMHRVQLIDGLYRHLQERFEKDIVFRKDDKGVVALFYVFEFLLKFHSRAFSWSSLERIDELVHIHRSPDLRRTLVNLVEQSSERYMHHVLNGIYEFRFRGAFAAELKYISKTSEVEQEAFNFTLDESQNLKASYLAILSRSDVTNVDIIFGLAELYEYDQEYETSRHFYRHCVRLHDESFFYHVGRTESPSKIDESISAIRRKLAESSNGIQDVRADLMALDPNVPAVPKLKGMSTSDLSAADVTIYMPWGVKRLRLMLHIAMTEEQSNNFQSAFAHYANSAAFAETLISGFWKGSKRQEASNSLEMLKHMPVLYQPMFALAWIAEKMEDGVDTSISIVEKNLRFIRKHLDFLNKLEVCQSEETVRDFIVSGGFSKSGVGNSNFSLIGSEIHNKSGDLYFYKGGSARPLEFVRAMLDPMLKVTPMDQFNRQLNHINFGRVYRDFDTGFEGYSLKAHYHYCVGLHELRRFIFYRRVVSQTKLNPLLTLMYDHNEDEYRAFGANGLNELIEDRAELLSPDPKKADLRPVLPTIARATWPNHVFKGVYNNLSDIADSFLSRVSLSQLMRELSEFSPGKPPENGNDDYLTSNSRKNHFGFVFSQDPTGCFQLPDTGAQFESILSTFHDQISAWMEQSDLETVYRGFVEIAAAEQSEGPPGRTGEENQPENEARVQRDRDDDIDEYFKEFFGSWTTASEPTSDLQESLADNQQLISFGLATCSMDRLLNGIFLGMAAAKFAEKGGYAERAAREYLLVARTCSGVLGHIRSLSVFSNDVSMRENPQVGPILSNLRKLLSQRPKIKGKRCLVEQLIGTLSQAVLVCMERYSSLSEEGWSRHNEAYKIGSVVQESAVTILCGGILHGLDAQAVNNQHQRDRILSAMRLLRTWFGGSAERLIPEDAKVTTKKQFKRAEVRAALQSVLQYVQHRHPYPVLNQLIVRKLQVDDLLLGDIARVGEPTKFTEKEVSQLRASILELADLSSKFDAPQLFTPMELAVTAGLYSVWEEGVAQSQGRNTEPNTLRPRHRTIGKMFRKNLRHWREMIYMGRAYYISIKDRYYLYDDFNDRQYHTNHARQMSGADLLALLDAFGGTRQNE